MTKLTGCETTTGRVIENPASRRQARGRWNPCREARRMICEVCGIPIARKMTPHGRSGRSFPHRTPKYCGQRCNWIAWDVRRRGHEPDRMRLLERRLTARHGL